VARPAEDRIDTGRTFGPQPGNGQPLDWRSRPENALSPTPAAVHAGIEPGHDADFGLALTLATALYAQTLPQHPDAVAYLRWRGISLSAARALHLGYADGRALADYLTSEPELRAAARACGLVGRGSAERFAGRLVVPEIRAGRTVWLIGRRVPPAGGARREASASREASPPDDPADRSPARGHREPPKYLGLTAPRHFLLGYGRTCAALARLADRASGGEPLVPGILVVEGALDYVVAQDWHLPAPCVALLGTHPSPGQFAELADLRRRARGAPLVLALDNDEAGRTATRDLARSLARQGLTLVILPPVADVKDLGELALLPSGRACLLRLLDEVCRHPTSAGFDHVREPPPDVIAARDRADARAGDAGAGGTP
jgi:DNA primase